MKLKHQALLEVLLQTDSMTWLRSVNLVPRRDCKHLLFKQVALDSLSYLYTVSMVCLDSSTVLLHKLLKMVYSNYQFTVFPFLSSNSPTSGRCLFCLYLYCQKHKQACKLQRVFSNSAHLKVEECAQLAVHVATALCRVRDRFVSCG